MHEMALCEGIRATVDEVARRNGARRVTVVRIEIGRFAGVEKHALAFAFDVVMRGSLADGARVEMIDLPGRAFCFGCGGEVEIHDRLAPCPVCGGGQLVPSGGEEMRIRDMEVL